MKRRGFASAALGLLLCIPLFGAAIAAPSVGDATSVHASADRVIVLAVPGLRWEHIDADVMPGLHDLAMWGSIALLSPQTAAAHSGPDDAYATLGAGARVVGSVHAAAHAPHERIGSQSSAELYRANTGRPVADAELVAPGLGALRSANAGLPYQGEVGALAEALRRAGHLRMVVAAADVVQSDGEVQPHRDAALALLDMDGGVEFGATGSSVLRSDPSGPFGLTYDVDLVLDAVDRGWQDASVILVEASMTARAAAEHPRLSPEQQVAAFDRARRQADELLLGLQERAGPRTAILVVGAYADPDELTALLLDAGTSPGLLRSASTRRAGHVLLVDLAPTILALLDVARPASMEGRSVEALEDSERGTSRLASLLEVERSAEFRDDIIGPVATMWIVAQILVLVGALWFHARGPLVRTLLGDAALALLCFIPVTFAVAPMSLHKGNLASYAVLTAGIAAIAARLLRARFPDRRMALCAALASIVLVLGMDVVTGSNLQMNALFGYTPTVAGRFTGIGNLAFAALAAASLLLVALLVQARRISLGTAMAFLAAVVLLDGLPRWGADVGGVLSLVPASGLLLILLRGRSLRLGTLVLLGFAALVVLGSFLVADLAQPEEQRTHLARLAESVNADGADAFVVVIRRKIGANVAVLSASIFVLAVPIILVLAGWAFWRGPGALRAVHDAAPTLRPGLGAVFVAAILGFALNDSGIAVPAVMFGVVNATICALLVQVAASDVSGDQASRSPQIPPDRRNNLGSAALVGSGTSR